MKGHVIGFRVDLDQYQEIEKQAEKRGEEVSEWCRNLVLSESGKDVAMTWTERLIYEEIGRMSYLIGHGFGLLSTGQLTAERWKQVVRESKEQAAATAQKSLDQRLGK